MVDVLAELEQRAGASDRDREAWLAERRQGVTATEISKLYLAQGGARQALARDLIEQKLGIREDPFKGNAFTAWGVEREPVLAEVVRQRYAIEPESRVFHAADNPRFLASPDGLGVGFDGAIEISELKTAGRDMSIGSPAYERAGYRIQKTWGMRVTTARRCLYGWEERIEIADGVFAPGEQRFEWFQYDEALADELVAIGEWFLVELDAKREQLAAGTDSVIDEELDTHALNLLRFRKEEAEAKKAKERAWSELHRLLKERGGDFSQRSALAQITYTQGAVEVEERVDDLEAAGSGPGALRRWEALQKARHDLAERERKWAEFASKFTREVEVERGPKLTVTAVKQKGEKR